MHTTPMTQFKYYIPTTPNNPWSAVSEERAKKYDLVLIDIIDNGIMVSEACLKHGLNHPAFYGIISQQRKLGLHIQTKNGGHRCGKFDPNGIYKYWVVPATREENQTVEFGKMMDVLIGQLIAGETIKVLAERFGVAAPNLARHISRCRKNGSPIPNFPARGYQTKRGGDTEANPEIFHCVDGRNAVKPHIILEWVDKRLQGYTTTWIATEYRVAGWTVCRLTKPLMPA
jgi:hypothetical protein